jgi:hypothetical protein
MCDQASIARISAIGELATMIKLHIEWQESTHGQTDESQARDVGVLGALVTVIVVLCTYVLSAVPTAVFMLVS